MKAEVEKERESEGVEEASEVTGEIKTLFLSEMCLLKISARL